MRKICIVIVLFFAITGCKEISPEQRQREIERTRAASRAYDAAVLQANNNDPAGFLKLYEIANNADIYTAEYSAVAEENIYLLLFAKTELWIKTFSKLDLQKLKTFVKGIEVSRLPQGVVSEEQFKETIFTKLKKIRGDKREMELVDYILDLYGQKRH